MEYKGYTLIPEAVCFDVRWFVYGDGFFGLSYETYEKACEAIDQDIAKTYINNLLDKTSKELDVSREILIGCLKNIICES